MENAKEQCHEHRFDVSWHITMWRSQSFADRNRKTIHSKTYGEKYDGEQAHCLAFGAIASRHFALGDIGEFGFDKLTTDRRNTVRKDMSL